jgi:outer membrane protein TolC
LTGPSGDRGTELCRLSLLSGSGARIAIGSERLRSDLFIGINIRKMEYSNMVMKKPLHLPGALLAALLLPAPASALDLEATVRQALANNDRIRAQDHRLRAADARVEAARGGYWPQLAVEVGARHTNNPGQAFMAKLNQGDVSGEDFGPQPGTYSTLNDPDPTTDVATALVLRQPVYRGGATTAQVRQASSGRDSAQQDLRSAQLRVALGATEAYLRVQLARARVEVTREALEAARGHRNMAEHRYQAGSALRSDILQARTRVSELEERLLANRNQLELAKSRLNEMLGRKLDAPVDIEGELQAPEDVRAAQLGELTEQAVANRPALASLRSRLQGARAGVDAATAALLPQVNLQARMEDHRADEADQSWLVGAQLQWQLFAGGANWAEREAATAEKYAARAQLSDRLRQIRLEVKRAHLNLETAVRRLETAGRAVESARESLRTTSNRYEQGSATMVELLDAQLARHQARLRRLKAMFDVRMGRARLQQSIGQLPVLETAPPGRAGLQG